MSDGNEKHQIDPEKDAGHHNLGYQNDEEKKIGIKDLEEDLRKEKHNVDDEDNEQELEAPKGNSIMQKFATARDYPFVLMSENPKIVSIVIKATLFILWNIYLIFAIKYMIDQEMHFADSMCHGLGFVVILTIMAYTGLFYYKVVIPYFGDTIAKYLINPLSSVWNKVFSYVIAQIIAGLAAFAALITFIVIDSKDEPERLQSLAGVAICLLIGFIFSAFPGHVKWRTVLCGVFIEFIMGILVLRWDIGNQIFQCIGDKAAAFLGYTNAGATMVYGSLVDSNYLNSLAIRNFNWNSTFVPEDKVETLAYIAEGLDQAKAFNPVFMFQTLSVIFFVSFCVSMLFYLGALQWVVMKMGWMLNVAMGTTAVESLNTAGNIFLGQTEAPLLIRPFIKDLTKSEIHAVMTGGFATIAGTVLAAFINMGIDPALLISASIMAAPAALAFSKLWYPETEKTKTSIDTLKIEKIEAANILDAAAQGASIAIMVVLNIGASLVAFLAFVEFINQVIIYLAFLLGNEEIDLLFIIGKIFVPMAYILGIPSQDIEIAAKLIGTKTVINEFTAYDKLGEYTRACTDENGNWIDGDSCEITYRTQSILSFALCGFANPSSIGIQVAGLRAMAPSRGKEISEVVFRAFLAGVMTTSMNACVAGALLSTK